MKNNYFHMTGHFNRVQYFASLFMAALAWGLMVLIFEGPAREQFSQSNILPAAITITPPLLFFLFAAIKRFRHLETAWLFRVAFLAAVILLAVSDMAWPDFSQRYRFYYRVLVFIWGIGMVLLLVWPGSDEKTPSFSGG